MDNFVHVRVENTDKFYVYKNLYLFCLINIEMLPELELK